MNYIANAGITNQIDDNENTVEKATERYCVGVSNGYWEAVKSQLLADNEVAQFLKSISTEEVQVNNRANPGTQQSQVGFCHLNVREHVKRHDGKQIYGWQIVTELTEGKALQGCAFAVFHSNWLDGKGQLWDITEATLRTRLFLPDSTRSFNFDTLTGYNNRVVFFSDYMPKHPLEQVARNKTYYTALGFKSRDRVFEKYTQPQSTAELLSSLPQKFRENTNNGEQLNYEGMEWLALKYSVKFNS
jgi:hypothetical protein